MADFEKAFNKTVAREGGYCDDKADRGGETKFGISKKSYPYLDIKTLTMADARIIYRRDFWDPINGDDIESDKIAGAIFDISVNTGVAIACAMAQRAAGISPVDGVIGSRSVEALNKLTDDDFLVLFALRVIERYVYICTRLPDQKRFLLGWVRRAVGIGLTSDQ